MSYCSRWDMEKGELKPIEKEDYELYGNPFLQETVRQFLEKQKELLEEIPEAEEYECRMCGDCCRWNFYLLPIEDTRFLDHLVGLERYPHGYWVINDGRIHCHIPIVRTEEIFHFDAPLPEGHVEFLKKTGRLHGYWVFDAPRSRIIAYNPTPCIQLKGDNSCRIYKTRPEICRGYICKRYPIES